jgi:hypothetical protein
VNGTGEKGSGMAIWAATAVTAAMSATRVIVATFKLASLSTLSDESGLPFSIY